MEYGCIGKTLRHSYSKEIHARLGDYPYDLFELEEAELCGFFKKRDFRGINVTIPYKELVLPYLDFLSHDAGRVGAVNTVVNRDGKLFGYNTDVFGLSCLLRKLGTEVCGKKVLILGTGGTSKTARAVCEKHGAKETIRVSRTGKEGAVTYEEAVSAHRDADILINATPCGMYPDNDSLALELSAFPRLCAVADAVYNPLRSRLVLEAKKRGIPASGGLLMLAAQGVRASRYFLGKEPKGNGIGIEDDEDFEKALRVTEGCLFEKENLVLCGMPGAGKTTLGRLCARSLGREFVDTDEEIVNRCGKSIPEIFATIGEAGFRALEGEVIRDVSKKAGLVISAGGGAVLSEENVTSLRENGRIFFLDVPVSLLCPTEDRPLARSREALEMLYGERHGRYCEVCDERVVLTRKGDDREENAARIAGLFKEAYR